MIAPRSLRARALGRKRTAVACALVAIVCLASASASDEIAEAKTVLLLYGESRLLPSIVAADEAIRATLTARSPRPITFHTEYLESLSGRPGASFEPELAPPRAGEVQRIAIDASRAERELGWRAEMDLEEGLRVTLDSI